jgi:ribonucleotide reductase beta subunit family protein with ferritin-like domain
MISEAVALEKQFVTGAFAMCLPFAVLTKYRSDSCIKPQWIGMSLDSMLLYIEFVADNLLVNLRHSKIYNTRNPVKP